MTLGGTAHGASRVSSAAIGSLPERQQPGTFSVAGGAVDVAVVIVSYQSAADLPVLIRSLRVEAAQLKIRVIVADNASTDGSADVARGEPDVIVVESGGNVGYAAGINAAMSRVGEAASVLVLNPDLTLDPGCLMALLARLRSAPSVGVVVPKILDPAGAIYRSLRREPNLVRAASDAVFGRRWLSRPEFLSEFVRDDRAYASARPVDWATGAAMLVSRAAWDVIGQWDEHFFLYSEETDYCRRARIAGLSIWYEPAAVVRHRQAGSGSSDALTALVIVNRLRYIEKYLPQSAFLHRIILVVHEQLRRRDPTHALARHALWSRRRWESLPGARVDVPSPSLFPPASVIIPAHNESAVIERTLAPLIPLIESGALEVIVSCNGCSDDTAAKAGRHPGVTVLQSPHASKISAINSADAVATRWPRLYLDADIEASPAALVGTVRALTGDGILAARPEFRYDTSGSTPLVRAYFRARRRMRTTSNAMWGAGLYGLSQAGHAILGAFPDVMADDLYIDQLFPPGRKRVVAGPSVVVRTPRTTRSLLQVMTRARRGPAQQAIDTGPPTARELIRTVTGIRAAVDAACFATLAVTARRRARPSVQRGGGRRSPGWERDESSRVGVDV